jgi:predicted transcriptional regulator
MIINSGIKNCKYDNIQHVQSLAESVKRKNIYMNLSEIIELVDGTVLNPEVGLSIKIRGGCGADLMSDVLASSQPKAVLLTGLTNPQVVRTAQIAEIRAIIFVRGKQPQAETLVIASQENIPLISSPFGMFELCGRLHRAGLPSFESHVPTS